MSKILIIEDDDVIAELERDYLELSGFEVEIEANGEDGLNRALSEYFDLFLLDVMLPGMDGFEICRRIRQEKSTPILMVTARKEEIDKIRGLGLGADDYLTKPFSPSELVARVKARLAAFERIVESLKPENRKITVRDLKIDLDSHEVLVRGEQKTLTVKEFDLLVLLATHPNRTYSKEELFQTIWKTDAIGEISTVSVHIKKLRQKIEKDPTDPRYIETVWGVGYRFII
ncbi:MAG: response regulator transcription factor [Lachnospiraceae bacterium]|nr:response regulator transcription factor [Lachnospiraceae bacterium]